MAVLGIKIFHESTQPHKAKRIIEKMQKHACYEFQILEISRYQDKGCLPLCAAEVQAKSWQDCFYKIIQFAEGMGFTWRKTGLIGEDVDLWSTEAIRVPGVTAIHLQMHRSVFEHAQENGFLN